MSHSHMLHETQGFSPLAGKRGNAPLFQLQIFCFPAMYQLYFQALSSVLSAMSAFNNLPLSWAVGVDLNPNNYHG